MGLSRSDRDAMALAAVEGSPENGAGWRRGPCPFCAVRLGKQDRKRSFGMHSDGLFLCFRCGQKGWLAGTSSSRPQAAPLDLSPSEMAKPDGWAPLWCAPGATSLTARPALRYLEGRGIGADLIERASIGACLGGEHFGRVVIPILGQAGEWLGWVGRTWRDGLPMPYYYPSGMPRRVMLYNHDALTVETDAPAIIVEGVFDALSVDPYGCAVLGKPSSVQVDAMAEARRPIAVVLDGDAWEEGWALAMKLRFMGQRAGAVRLPPRVDPDEVPIAWLLEETKRCIAA